VPADPHATLRDQVLNTVLRGPGETNPALREAAADRAGLPANLESLVDVIHRHAYKVTDGDVARLGREYNDDELFEVIVCAAVGASRNRLLAGLAALNEA
jgi:hypothetical protein